MAGRTHTLIFLRRELTEYLLQRRKRLWPRTATKLVAKILTRVVYHNAKFKCTGVLISKMKATFINARQMSLKSLLHLARTGTAHIHTSLECMTKKTLSAADKYAAVTKCKDACGDDSDSSCVPECEVQMYWCFDFRKSKRVHHCQNNVIEEFKTFSKVWDQRHPYFLNVAKRALAPGDKQVAHAKCDAACSPLAESTCVPQCELQMFWCFDFQDLASLNQCQTDVVGEFLVSSKMKNKTRRLRHPHPRHHHHYHGTMHSTATEAVTHLNNTAAATLEATELVHTIGSGGRPMGKLQGAEARCQDACHHNAHTGCTLECQVAMYWCLEANSTHDVSHCQQKVFLEYNTENIQGEDWNKEHPLSLPLP